MALDTEVTDAVPDVVETAKLGGVAEDDSPLRLQLLTIAALQAILDELQAQTVLLDQIANP